jgi:hypothetical protein
MNAQALIDLWEAAKPKVKDGDILEEVLSPAEYAGYWLWMLRQVEFNLKSDEEIILKAISYLKPSAKRLAAIAILECSLNAEIMKEVGA